MKKLSLLLMMVLGCFSVVLAQRTISGTITDDAGEALIGASVLVKGTTTGTVTDFDGNYELTIPDGTTTLTASYTGYSTQDIELSASNVVNITMSEGVTLQTAVVTALGVQRDEKAVGYAVQQVDGEAVQRSGATSAIDGLRGQAAGVNIVRSSGAAGGGSRIVIRGQTSLTGNNQALMVVDGVRINNSSFYTEAGGGASSTGGSTAGSDASNRGMDINPDDIESINVLKGAAATALYGVDGANGVVVITTKKGSGGKGFKVNAGYMYTTETITNMPELQTSFAQGTGGEYRAPETGASGSWGPAIGDLEYDGATDYPYDPNGNIVPSGQGNGRPINIYDPIDQFFQTGASNQANLSISGGAEKASFRFSTSLLGSQGIIPNNQYNRNTFALSGNLQLTDKITVTASANYVQSDAVRVQQGSNTSGLLLGLLRTPPSFDNSNGVADPVNDDASYVLPSGGQRNYRGGGG
ncbi:MAG: carboxypeptidase-like regulatory domain-containing protein, partial [Saprospiraceae bacterium]